MAQHIRVVPYQPEWAEEYTREAALIRGILDSELLAIHHIGSTAVPGLQAKPVIDIMPVVKSIPHVDAFFPQFVLIGYECLGEFGMPGRRYFRKGGDERTHQVHIFDQSNSLDIDRHLAVRDYLRVHREAADIYGRLKSALAKEHPYDINGYGDGKEDFVKNLEQTALQWRQSGKNKEG